MNRPHMPVTDRIRRSPNARLNPIRPLARLGCLLGLMLLLGPEARATKATAPFDIDVHFKGNHATVSVRAGAPMSDVVVAISGSDGLVVSGGELHGTVQVREFRRASLNRGELLTFEVDFTPGGPRSLLAVSADCAGEPALVQGFSPPVPAVAPASAARAAAAEAPPPAPAKLGWPIHANATFDDQHQHAHVTVTTSRPGTDIVVKVYGVDGLVVAGGTPEGNLVVRTERRATLKPGESFEFDVTVQPGEGQSYLVVSAQGKGIGSDLQNYSIGGLSEAQKRERQRGVTVDPEGRPIKLMGP
jgi:hypothetical protein